MLRSHLFIPALFLSMAFSAYDYSLEDINPSSEYYDTDGSRNDMGAYGGPNGNW